jgi:hopanoid biosynthesis associated RND transporter like protein HpnN
MFTETTLTRTQRWLSAWVRRIQHNAVAVLVVSVLLTLGTLYYSAANFKINTDIHAMMSDKLSFRKLYKEFSKAFPQQSDTLIVVIDGITAEQAGAARKAIAEQLRKEKPIFAEVYEPGAGAFFQKNGLLYLNTEELESLGDRLSAAQPFLAVLSQDLSIRGLFGVVEKAVEQEDLSEAQDRTLALLLDGMSNAFGSAVRGTVNQMSWEALALGAVQTAKQCRQFIILEPRVADASMPAESVHLETIRRVARQFGYNNPGTTRVRITGDFALAYENLEEVRNSTGIATVASLFLVALVLSVALYFSCRLIFCSLVTLIMALIWSTAFALATVGSLNMISVTFAVLFIGLGIDYSIQFCLRYRELLMQSGHQQNSITSTATSVGRSLFFSAATTALGFYSFVPTAYAGVAELGFISGSSMFISFFANITVLPALLTVLPVKACRRWKPSWPWLVYLPYRYPRGIVAVGALSALAALVAVPRVFFDYNPLNLHGKSSESVVTMKELFNDPEGQPWTASVLVDGEEEALRLAEQLKSLKEVRTAVTIHDFIPGNQQDKIDLISGIALFMSPELERPHVTRPTYEQNIQALARLEWSLESHLNGLRDSTRESAQKLLDGITRFTTLLEGSQRGVSALTLLDESLTSGLPMLLERLETSLQPSLVEGPSSLPRELRSQYVSADGRFRVQVFPRDDITNLASLEGFIRSVRSVAPNATDTPVTVYESGRVIAASFAEASLYAVIIICAFVLAGLRSTSKTFLILIPMALAFLFTAAASVLLGVPLNFANVIVVPLILGIGVHSGVIFIVRDWKDPGQEDNLLKCSMARATLFSNLATMISTASLAFSPHLGIASIGMLLSICLAFLILSTLLFLPSLIVLLKVRLG